MYNHLFIKGTILTLIGCLLIGMAVGQTFSIPATQVLGYTDNKVIGTCSNCVQTEVALTSFEPAAPGGWVYNPAFTLQTLSKHSFTGFRYFNLSSGNVTKSIAPLTGKILVISYWTNASSKLVNGLSGTEGRTASIDGVVWKQYRHTLNNPSSITISGTGIIDELRMYPQDAEVSSYTYADDKGIITQCDAFDRVTYHEYDAFNRVSVVRDLDYRILKTYCYGQAGELHDCNTTIYYNDQHQSCLTRNDCMDNMLPGYVFYTVPANTYYSYISYADANQKALADIEANKQMFANLNGACNVIYQSDDFSGVYYSSLCTWPLTPMPIYVSVPANMHTSIISKAEANTIALGYAQWYADIYGQCNGNVTLNYMFWGAASNLYITFTKTDTYEQYFFTINSGGSGSFGSVPQGNYDININASSWHSFEWSFYFQSGTNVTFYNVRVGALSNSLIID